ncbi:MAG: hypothetical protein EOO77_12345 [Oxalobacteraceae bacterium]|nr:MAG: hypothetical protein EOO77_12345 [Oxalobacteraceae bacterium]
MRTAQAMGETTQEFAAKVDSKDIESARRVIDRRLEEQDAANKMVHIVEEPNAFWSKIDDAPAAIRRPVKGDNT